jgi:hypothetical protein
MPRPCTSLDEGDGYAGGTDLYTHAAAKTTAGLQKWVQFVHQLLEFGLHTAKRAEPGRALHDPGLSNAATGLLWAPATDGLRNLTGVVGEDGYVAIGAITSTIRGNGDQGADPNQLLAMFDSVQNTDPTVAPHERFFTLRQAGFGEVSCAAFLSRPEPTSISMVDSRYGSSTLPDRLDR